MLPSQHRLLITIRMCTESQGYRGSTASCAVRYLMEVFVAYVRDVSMSAVPLPAALRECAHAHRGQRLDLAAGGWVHITDEERNFLAALEHGTADPQQEAIALRMRMGLTVHSDLQMLWNVASINEHSTIHHFLFLSFFLSLFIFKVLYHFPHIIYNLIFTSCIIIFNYFAFIIFFFITVTTASGVHGRAACGQRGVPARGVRGGGAVVHRGGGGGALPRPLRYTHGDTLCRRGRDVW